MSCTNRPATQPWENDAQCGTRYPDIEYIDGNLVTGNGTSTTRCQHFAWRYANLELGYAAFRWRA
jgi:hypothetical protein